MKQNRFILLTIDVEDWFQVENFKPWIPFNTWPSYELRVEKNTHRLLDLFDSITYKETVTLHQRDMELSQFHQETEEKKSSKSCKSCQTKTNTPKATFFILGWISERLPHLVQEIHSRGHEVASHGCNHNLCTECSSEDLKTDLIQSKKLLEDIIGDRVYGYRAPSFAINNDILKIIKDCGYQYDSSYNSFNLHGRYGKISLNGIEKKGIAIQISKIQNPAYSIQHQASSNLYELPISNFKFGKYILPFGGGAYFRMIPFDLFKIGIRKILRKENAYLFYLHPWEIDPEQPKVKNAFLTYKFRHYTNLSKTYSKLSNLIKKFQRCRFVTCSQYLNSQTSSLRPACHCKPVRKPSPPGIRLRRSRWRTGKARRPGAHAGRSQFRTPDLYM